VHFRRLARTGGLFALAVLAVLALAAALPLALLSRQLGTTLPAVVFGLPSAAVGVLVARRQPRNPLGWLFLLTAVGLLLGTDAGNYAVYVYSLGHRLPLGPAGVVLDQVWVPSVVLLVVIILLFPDGALPSGPWRWALRAFWVLYVAFVGSAAVAMAADLSAHPVRADSGGGLAVIDHPVGWFAVVVRVVVPGMLALAAAFVGRQVLSWRHSSGERRQQLKWLASGAAVAIVSAVVAAPLAGTSPRLGWLHSLLWCGLAALPVSMGVAILRYRLYEIDRIISRTLAYAIVTGLLVGVYAGLVLLTTQVLRFHDQVAVAASTLIAAALFSPLRRRVQRVVDRHFNRARYDADLTVAAFAARLQDAVDLDALAADLAAMVETALEPAHVSLWTAERRS
jgi:hypothetical protein